MKVRNEAQQRIIFYCKNWYGTTGDMLEDFKIVLDSIFYTKDWQEGDIASVLLNEFDELIKENYRMIIGKSIFGSQYFPSNRNDFDSKIKFLKTIKSIIGFTEADRFDGLDKKYKELFKLDRRNYDN